MGKLTCPPPQFRFAEEGEKGNYAAYRPTTGNHEDRSGKRSYHRGNDCTASPCDEERAAWRSGVLLSGEVIAARRRLGYYYLGGGEDPAAAEIRSCTAEDCMSRPILVGAESNAYDAAVLLFTEDIGTLFVGKKDDIQGVVSRKDLLKAAMGRDDLAKVPISMVMTSRSKMIYAEPKEDLVSIAQKMMDYEVDCLPVGTFKNVGNDRKFVLIGRVSKTNITRLFLELGKGGRK